MPTPEPMTRTEITPEIVERVYGVTDESYAREIADALNCKSVGTIGHSQCGVCPEHHTSLKVCGCQVHDGVRQTLAEIRASNRFIGTTK